MGSRPLHDCRECGYRSPKWLGRCPQCQSWDSFDEQRAPDVRERETAATVVAYPEISQYASHRIGDVEHHPSTGSP